MQIKEWEFGYGLSLFSIANIFNFDVFVRAYIPVDLFMKLVNGEGQNTCT